MKAGASPRAALGQQRVPQHAGIARRISGRHPTLIAKYHIHPIPRQMFLIEHAIGRRRSSASGESDVGSVALIEGEIDQRSDALGALARQLGGIADHLQFVAGGRGAHQRGPTHIHSVWKLPG